MPVCKCLKNATSHPLADPFLRRSCIMMQKKCKKMQLLAKTESAKKCKKCKLHFLPSPGYHQYNTTTRFLKRAEVPFYCWLGKYGINSGVVHFGSGRNPTYPPRVILKTPTGGYYLGDPPVVRLHILVWPDCSTKSKLIFLEPYFFFNFMMGKNLRVGFFLDCK